MKLLLLPLIAWALPGQSPAIEGMVRNQLTSQPLSKVTVVLRRVVEDRVMPANGYAAESDSNGRFQIPGAEPGIYAITAERRGYTFYAGGATGAPPPRLAVELGAGSVPLSVGMLPLGVITGHVLSSHGEPLGGVSVSAMRNTYGSGGRELSFAGLAVTTRAGAYRLFDLHAGHYSIQAVRTQGILQETFSPSKAVDVVSGGETPGGDLILQPGPMLSIRGRIENSSHQPVANSVSLEINKLHSGRLQWNDEMQSDGSFRSSGFDPGPYTITVIGSEGGRKTYARRDVTLGNVDLADVTLVTFPFVEVKGNVRIEGGSLTANPNLRIRLSDPDDEFDRNLSFEPLLLPDGSFVCKQVAPAKLVVQVLGSNQAYLKSLRRDNQSLPGDEVDFSSGEGALNVTLGVDTGEVHGKVKTRQAKPAGRVRVTLIPYGAHLGRNDYARFSFTDEEGNFKIAFVPPGEYRAFAWEDVEPGAPRDPAYRKPFEEQSVSITVTPRGSHELELTSIPPRPPGQ